MFKFFNNHPFAFIMVMLVVGNVAFFAFDSYTKIALATKKSDSLQLQILRAQNTRDSLQLIKQRGK